MICEHSGVKIMNRQKSLDDETKKLEKKLQKIRSDYLNNTILDNDVLNKLMECYK